MDLFGCKVTSWYVSVSRRQHSFFCYRFFQYFSNVKLSSIKINEKLYMNLNVNFTALFVSYMFLIVQLINVLSKYLLNFETMKKFIKILTKIFGFFSSLPTSYVLIMERGIVSLV